MSTTPRDPFTRTMLLVFAGVASVAMLIGSIALLIWVRSAANRAAPTPPAPANVTIAPDAKPPGTPWFSGTAITAAGVVPATSPAAKRFTLRLGQGFRFTDAVVVVNKPDERSDVAFKFVAPQVGGLAIRFNPVAGQLETAMEPTLNSPVPLLLAARVKAFDDKPYVARITSGDAGAFDAQAPIHSKTRYVLLQTHAGDHYLLTLDEMEAVPGKYDDWRIGFTYEQVQLPVGLAGGKISKPLPGKLIFRDGYHSKMIERVDLTTGKEETLTDGVLPSTFRGDRLLAYVDTSDAIILRDTAGNTIHTIRLNEKILCTPQLAPDGKRLLVGVYRRGPDVMMGQVAVKPPETAAVGVFDLTGHEIVSVMGYDDLTWTPDGKVIATGKYNEPGLFEIDPATKAVRPIDPKVSYPASPSVSADGKTIVFITGGKAWLIDRDGKNLRQVFPHGMQQQRPVFSPDGTKVALVICNQFANDFTGELFVVDLKTRDLTPLRTSTGTSLSPDSTSRLSWIE